MKKKLVILTTHFGTNFSGGSTATCEIFIRLQDQFTEIVVIGTKLGHHQFSNLRFIKYRNWIDAIRKLKNENQNALFYGDFYNSFLFILAQTPFYFTYHDNWPELASTGFANQIRSLFYTNTYKLIFKKALKTITVSEFKLDFVKKISSNAYLIHNGFEKKSPFIIPKEVKKESAKKILMVGNVDQRKYQLALKLFNNWTPGLPVHIDIYGNLTNEKIALQLKQIPFVRIKGFVNPVPFEEYDLLLHTSSMENLPITFCEAIYYDTPIVAFDVGGNRELVQGDLGVLIPPYDISMMQQAIESTLKHKKKGTKTTVLDKHCWTLASSKYQNILNLN